MQDAVGDQPAPDAGSERHQDEVGGASTSTELPLGHRRTCGVVVERHGVPEALADLSPTIRKDGQLAITYRIGEQSIEGLLTRLRDAKVGISDLATEEPDLEDVFVSLTSA